MMTCGKFLLHIAILLLAGKPLFAEEPVLDSPEQEVQSAIERIGRLENGIDAAFRLASDARPLSDTSAANQAFANGRQYLQGKHLMAAAREFDLFLSLKSMPTSDEYLEAHRNLGDIALKFGLVSLAKSHFHTYVSTMLTHAHADYDGFATIMRQLLLLTNPSDPTDQTRMRELMAAIVTVPFPQEAASECMYIAAKAAFRFKIPLAKQWLANIATFDPSAHYRARALYYRGMLALEAGDEVSASQWLYQALEAGRDDSDDLKSRINLDLARLESKQRRFEKAYAHFDSVSPKSTSYRDALYEQIFANLDAKNYTRARIALQTFAEQYPKDPEALRLSKMTPYFDLLSSDLHGARKAILVENEVLRLQLAEITKRIRGKTDANFADLRALVAKTSGEFARVPAMLGILRLYRNAHEISRRMAAIHKDAKELVIGLGQASFDQLLPLWHHRFEQVDNHTHELLEIGHRMIAVERNLDQTNLTPGAVAILGASEGKRIAMFTQRNAVYSVAQWKYFRDYGMVHQRLVDRYASMFKMRAELASLTFATKNSKMTPRKLVELKAMVHRASVLSHELGKTSERLYTKNIQSIHNTSPERPLNWMLQRYASALENELKLLQPLRGQRADMSSKMLAKDFETSWKRWNHLAKQIERQLNTLQSESDDVLFRYESALQNQHQRFEDTKMQLGKIHKQLKRQFAVAYQLALKQYERTIRTRLAKNEKWAADIRWAEADKTALSLVDLKDQLMAERENIEAKYYDLNVGAIDEWLQL